MGLPPGKRQGGFELGQPEMHLRIRQVSGIFKGVGQGKAREDRAEEVLPGENYHGPGLLVVSHAQRSPGPHTEALIHNRMERRKGKEGTHRGRCCREHCSTRLPAGCRGVKSRKVRITQESKSRSQRA